MSSEVERLHEEIAGVASALDVLRETVTGQRQERDALDTGDLATQGDLATVMANIEDLTETVSSLTKKMIHLTGMVKGNNITCEALSERQDELSEMFDDFNEVPEDDEVEHGLAS